MNSSQRGLKRPCLDVFLAGFGPHQLKLKLFQSVIHALFSSTFPFSSDFLQYLLEAGWAAEGKVIGVTQPRRVAAISVRAPLMSYYFPAPSLPMSSCCRESWFTLKDNSLL